MLTMVH